MNSSQRSRWRPPIVKETQSSRRQKSIRFSGRGAFPHRDGRRRGCRSSRPQALAYGPDALRRKPFACATRSTASSSPLSRASSAAGRRPKRITFASPNRGRSAERSATNTRSPSAGSITAICTATAMRPHGGPPLASTHCPSLLSCGEGRASLSFARELKFDVPPMLVARRDRGRQREPGGECRACAPGVAVNRRRIFL